MPADVGVTKAMCPPIEEKSGRIVFEQAHDGPLPDEDRLNMSGIEENKRHVEEEKDRDCRPENGLASPTPKAVNVKREIDSRKSDSLCQSIVLVQGFLNPREPDDDDHDRAGEKEGDQNSKQKGIGDYYPLHWIPKSFQMVVH
jgi:hypothetical protein